MELAGVQPLSLPSSLIRAPVQLMENSNLLPSVWSQAAMITRSNSGSFVVKRHLLKQPLVVMVTGYATSHGALISA